jgi:hypothetical protein
VWEELVSITQMRWRFQEEEEAGELVQRLAATLGWVEEQRHVLVADYLHQAWRPEVVSGRRKPAAHWAGRFLGLIQN